MDEFDVVVSAYKQHFLDLGFIPKSTLYRYYYQSGKIKFIGNSFIIIGSYRTYMNEPVKIHALYVCPEHRNSYVVHELLHLIDRTKKYQVRCTEHGVSYWKYHGLNIVSISKNNRRKREIFCLQGYLR